MPPAAERSAARDDAIASETAETGPRGKRRAKCDHELIVGSYARENNRAAALDWC